MIKASLKVAASYYPGRTFRLYIVNIPTWFSVVYGIVKSVFTAQQQQKVRLPHETGFQPPDLPPRIRVWSFSEKMD